MKNAPFHISIRVTRVELDCLIHVRDSQVEPIAALPEIGALDQGRDVLGVETERFVDVGKGTIEIIVLVPDHTSHQERERIASDSLRSAGRNKRRHG